MPLTMKKYEQQKEKEKKEKMESNISYVRKLHPEFVKRNIAIGKVLSNAKQQYEGDIYLDDKDQSLHFPVLFLYEEYHQSDWIADFNENHTFEEHLSYMFPSKNPEESQADFAPWDVDHRYFLEDLEIYVEMGVCNAYNPSDYKSKTYNKKIVKVKKN